ncbi:MAG: ATP-binding cassette domain-containing protein [Spirochaetia bacterium]
MNPSLGPPLAIQNLRFTFPPVGDSPAEPLFTGLEYSLSEQARGVILGGADAGKTTLARICANLVPRFTGGTLSGTIFFGDRNAMEVAPFDAVESIGLVFQDPDEQIFTTRCDTEIAFALESLGFARTEMEKRIANSLDFMGLLEFRPRNPATLSGGEKKRLLIACLAAIDPQFWMLDEVFQELDATWKLQLLQHLSAGSRTALFFDSRWSPLYASRCGNFAVLRDGVISSLAADMNPTARETLLAKQGLCLSSEEAGPRQVPERGEPFIKAEGLFFQFGAAGSFDLAIDSLQLERGSVCALVGRNGSGKSTLGKLLCGLLAPARGTISLNEGGRFRHASGHELHSAIGYLFQNPDYQVFLPTVSEELAFGLRAAGIVEAQARDRVAEAIRLFRLPAGGTPPALMSYGARKRLQAATFHLLGRAILILDEIDAGLTYGEFLPIVELLASSGAGIVIVTHDIALARRVCGRIIWIEGGRITRDLVPDGFSSLDALAGETV